MRLARVCCSCTASTGRLLPALLGVDDSERRCRRWRGWAELDASPSARLARERRSREGVCGHLIRLPVEPLPQCCSEGVHAARREISRCCEGRAICPLGIASAHPRRLHHTRAVVLRPRKGVRRATSACSLPATTVLRLSLQLYGEAVGAEGDTAASQLARTDPTVLGLGGRTDRSHPSMCSSVGEVPRKAARRAAWVCGKRPSSS
eukprot:scaffold60852_cov63-Phaeocystis_antarctica.AAC.2